MQSHERKINSLKLVMTSHFVSFVLSNNVIYVDLIEVFASNINDKTCIVTILTNLTNLFYSRCNSIFKGTFENNSNLLKLPSGRNILFSCRIFLLNFLFLGTLNTSLSTLASPPPSVEPN